ncbi:MAG: c-type cytochrome [Rhodomicrobium sp.]
MKRAIVSAGIVAAVLLPGAASAQSQANIRTGREIAERFCARCHAIGIEGKSPHASALPLRDIVAKGNVENLEEALGEGIVVGHPDMPQFQFKPHEVGALIAYLKSLSGKG